ncbi:ATP-binding protein [Bdellovibrionota bacterium FG-1]
MEPKEIFVGRKAEKTLLQQAWASNRAELVAVYGRRRIGKTELIRETLKRKGGYMEVVGLKDGTMEEELEIFTSALQTVFYGGISIQRVPNWNAAFRMFTDEVKKGKKRDRFVLFLDELPWLATPKSGLLQALDHFWNTEWNLLPQLKIVLCGSAASWMIEKLIHAKGGLHNRITQTIQLQPFTLAETEEYLHSRNVKLSREQVLELYMAFGGVPFYLQKAQRGKSAAQIIDQVCFSRDGLLREEYQRLFSSLFSEARVQYRLFEEIARHRYGISRTELIQNAKIDSSLHLTSGGWLNERLRELEEAGFISSFVPYGKKKKEMFFRVIDEYCYFYLKWIASAPKGLFAGTPSRYWMQKRGTPAWRSWAGFTFEGVCLKHASKIQSALGLDSGECEIGTWRYMPPKKSKESGAQVDLLFDRADSVVTLCELKYSENEFVIDKSYAAELERKMDVFRKSQRKRKEIFLSLVTTRGVAQNVYYGRLVHSDVTLDALF